MLSDDKALVELITTGDETTKIVCRSCLQEKNEHMKLLRTVLNLDRFLYSLIPSDINVIGLYNYCVKKPVLINDGFTQYVCATCLKKFISTYEFLQQCEQAEARLQRLATEPEKQEVVYVNDIFVDNSIETSDDVEAMMKFDADYTEDTLDVQELDENLPIERLYESDEDSDLADKKSENSIVLERPAVKDGLAQQTKSKKGKISNNTMVTCEVCSKEMMYKNYKLHYQRMHNLNRIRYECKKCNTVLSSVANYKKHLTTKLHQEIPKRVPQYSKHKRAPCKICGKVFIEYYLERRHMLTHHSSKPFACDSCGLRYFTKASLTAHIAAVHCEKPTETTFLCPECGQTFDDHKYLRRHVESHNPKKAACEVCGKFVLARDLKTHMRTHTGERPYKCSVCGKGFGASSARRVHERQHSEQRPYPCPQCDKAFVRNSQLRIHSRVHTGEKIFKCDMCPMSFLRIDQLTRHQRDDHNTIGKYQCPICTKRYHRKESLKAHRYFHLGKTCKCHVCSSIYTYPNQLKRHLKLVHNIVTINETKKIVKKEELGVEDEPEESLDDNIQEIEFELLDEEYVMDESECV